MHWHSHTQAQNKYFRILIRAYSIHTVLEFYIRVLVGSEIHNRIEKVKLKSEKVVWEVTPRYCTELAGYINPLVWGVFFSFILGQFLCKGVFKVQINAKKNKILLYLLIHARGSPQVTRQNKAVIGKWPI